MPSREFVDPLGREHQRTVKQTRTFEAGEVLTTDARTLYVTLGDWVGMLSVASTLALLGAARWRKP